MQKLGVNQTSLTSSGTMTWTDEQSVWPNFTSFVRLKVPRQANENGGV